MAPEQSDALLQKVYEVSEKVDGNHVYNHHWQPGDMVIWVSLA